ncbi:MAG: prepilin-type N-terminal cleavage/methylation domain-containing protein [Pseudomonadota bacterium]
MTMQFNTTGGLKTGRAKGFTLIEMVGVVAVIAVLASVATPMVLDATYDAKASAIAQEVRTLKTAVTRFNVDTDRWPWHRPTVTDGNNNQLIANRTAGPVPGWDGPYIDGQLNFPVAQPTSGFYGVLGDWADGRGAVFDLDGYGNQEVTRGTVLMLQIPNEDIARKVSDILDGDGDNESGSGAQAWDVSGSMARWTRGGTSIWYNVLLADTTR